MGDGLEDMAHTARDTVIFVKSLTNETRTISVDLDETVFQTRKAIEGRSLMPQVTRYRIIFEGGQLEDGRTLGDYNVQKESKLHVWLWEGWCPPNEFPQVCVRVG